MYYDKNKIWLTPGSRYKNFMSICGYDRELVHLEVGRPGGGGGNSSVFRVMPGDDNPMPELVIKFCNHPENATGAWVVRRAKRFEREIDANIKAGSASLDSKVISLITDGRIRIGTNSFRYFIMPKADCNLGQYLDNNALSLLEKLRLCRNIFEAVHQLHVIGIYHRDIKPANFMMFNNTVKIGDLGLCAYRDEDGDLDKGDMQIGPFGFVSPEAVNRLYATDRSRLFGRKCQMDIPSDYFQLGLLFWYILQGDVPVGQLVRSDLKELEGTGIFEKVINPLLQFDRDRRATYSQMALTLEELARP